MKLTTVRRPRALTLSLVMATSMALCTGCDVADVLGAVAGALSAAGGGAANGNAALHPGDIGGNSNTPVDPGFGQAGYGNSNSGGFGGGPTSFGGFNGGGVTAGTDQPFVGRPTAPAVPFVPQGPSPDLPQVSHRIPQSPVVTPQVPPTIVQRPPVAEPPVTVRPPSTPPITQRPPATPPPLVEPRDDPANNNNSYENTNENGEGKFKVVSFDGNANSNN